MMNYDDFFIIMMNYDDFLIINHHVYYVFFSYYSNKKECRTTRAIYDQFMSNFAQNNSIPFSTIFVENGSYRIKYYYIPSST